MEITKETLKALASERRLDILKTLLERRKMPSELSKELNLSGSTIVEHLNILEKSGLVKRMETGHKWIYYELTNKGEDLIKPKFPVQFVLMLSLGIMFVISGIVKYMTPAGMAATAGAQMETATKAAETVAYAPTIDWIAIALILIGIILLGIGIYYKLKR